MSPKKQLEDLLEVEKAKVRQMVLATRTVVGSMASGGALAVGALAAGLLQWQRRHAQCAASLALVRRATAWR